MQESITTAPQSAITRLTALKAAQILASRPPSPTVQREKKRAKAAIEVAKAFVSDAIISVKRQMKMPITSDPKLDEDIAAEILKRVEVQQLTEDILRDAPPQQ